jgi:hypothetical protein
VDQAGEKGVRCEYEDENGGHSWHWLAAPDVQLKEWLGSGARREHLNTSNCDGSASPRCRHLSMRAMSNIARGSLTTTRLLFDRNDMDLRLHIVPESLLAAMWLQCARALTENPQFKRCEHFGKWFG